MEHEDFDGADAEDIGLLPQRVNGWSSAYPSRSPVTTTPLPWIQLSIVLFIRFCDALASLSIQPYINQRIGEMAIVGGDKRKVGYYVGMIDSLSQLAVTATIFLWNRLSDHIGRRPVLLIGISGSMLSMFTFGLADTVWGLLASQCLGRLLDGNGGVTKSVVGEITDSTNRARGFALMFVLSSVGGTVGSFLGGTLAKPSDHFPAVFSSNFWKQYPYMLPCLMATMITGLALLTTLLFFKETIWTTRSSQHFNTEERLSFRSNDKPLPLRQILVYPVIIAVSNYMALAFLASSHMSLFSLFFATPIEFGGLGFEPARIGYITGSLSAISSLFMATVFAKIVRRYKERRIFRFSIFGFLLMWTLQPMTNFCARLFGIGAMVWVGIALMLFPVICMDMAYSCIYVFITSAAPNKRSLGSTNGVSQTSISISRVIAPALSTSLFSFSAEHNILGGYAVYVILFGLSCLAVMLASRLPHDPLPSWEAKKIEDDDSVFSLEEFRGRARDS